jgi:hypothetical protein
LAVWFGDWLYVAKNARPDIACVIHQAATLTHHPCQSYAVGVKKIAQYLKHTKMEEMFISPQNSLRIDCYVDEEFASLFTVGEK